MIEIKVGSKGELFLPKSIRVKLNLKPGDKLFLDVNKDLITLKKVPDLNELLDMPYISKKTSVKESNEMIELEQDIQIKQTLDDLNG